MVESIHCLILRYLFFHLFFGSLSLSFSFAGFVSSKQIFIKFEMFSSFLKFCLKLARMLNTGVLFSSPRWVLRRKKKFVTAILFSLSLSFWHFSITHTKRIQRSGVGYIRLLISLRIARKNLTWKSREISSSAWPKSGEVNRQEREGLRVYSGED